MTDGKLIAVRHLALDLDGTLYRGGTLFDFTRGFLSRMDELGIGYTFLTNNSSKSVQDYLGHLTRLGIPARADQMYTSGLSTIEYLRREHPAVRSLYMLATVSSCAEFAAAGFTIVGPETEPDAVVVGFDTELTFAKLCRAAWWIGRGKPFIATHPDRVCPTDQPTTLVDCGAICACLESATGRAPTAVLGKPHASMLAGILRRHGLAPHELAMVGDRLYTDMAMARRSGAVGVLVLTGETRLTEIDGCAEPPDIVVPSLKELGDSLASARRRQSR